MRKAALNPTWATKSPAEVLADILAAYEAVTRPEPELKFYVYDPATDSVREATAADFHWLWVRDGFVPRPKAPLSWPRIPRPEAQVKRVQPRVLRNQPRNHPVRAFRRPW